MLIKLSASDVLQVIAMHPDRTTQEIALLCPRKFHTERVQIRHVGCIINRLYHSNRIQPSPEEPHTWSIKEESQ